MPAWDILITDGLEPNGQQILRSEAQVDDRTGIAPEELLVIIPRFDAVIVRGRTRLTRAVIDAAGRLRVIGRLGVGVDNIDLRTAQAHAVTVVNAPCSTTIAVAELTLGLLLALAREIPRLGAAMKAGRWLKNELTGVELAGKTLGLLGMGRIGSEVARRAAAFGMQVLAYDPLLAPDEIRRRQALPVTLDELFSRADFLSLHLPLTDDTRGMLGASAFARMKPGIRLVSTARGSIIDETALLEALESGRVAGAALDVFAQEPPGNNQLIEHPRLIATPHIGAQTQEAQVRASEDIAHEVLAALGGRSLRWKIV